MIHRTFSFYYRELVEVVDHALLVLEDEGIDHLHVGLLATKLDEVGQILQALCHHDERAGGVMRRCLGDEPKMPRVEDGRTQKAEEDEAGHDPSPHQPFLRPARHHLPLQAAANVPQCPTRNRKDALEGQDPFQGSLSLYFGQASADIKMDSLISSKITRRNSALAHASPPGSILEGFNYED